VSVLGIVIAAYAVFHFGGTLGAWLTHRISAKVANLRFVVGLGLIWLAFSV
jgi:hypothetical protein